MAARGVDLTSALRWSLRAWVSQWRYQSASPRDLRLDLLRGCFVVAMVVDHLGGQSWFYLLTGGNRFYVSAAEGFVALSGLVMGLVYARLIQRDGLWVAIRRALRRAATLYLLAVSLGLLFQMLSNALGATWALPMTSLGDLLIAIMTLRTGIYLADVLMLYALLVLVAPIALVLLQRGMTALLLGGAIGLWGVHHVGLAGSLDRYLLGLEWFPPLAWQLVFMVGLSLGYHWAALQRRVGRWRWGWHLLALIAAAAALIVLAQVGPGSPVAAGLTTFFTKEGLHPGRLLATAVFLPLLFGLITILWWPLRASLGWLLLPLGQHALWAYSFHLFAALAANIWWGFIPGYELTDLRSNTLAQALTLLIIWLITLTVQGTRVLVQRASHWLGVPPPPRPGLLVGRLALALGVASLIGQPLSLLPTASRLEPGVAVSAALPMSDLAQAGPHEPRAPAAVTAIARRSAPAAVTPITRRSAAAVATPPPSAVSTATAPTIHQRDDEAGRAPDGQPGGSRIVHRMVYSPALDRNMDCLIFLPAGYDESAERYPVLYLLHGLGGNYREWATNGLLERASQRLTERKLPPMLIVLPEGEDGYWLNHAPAGPRWGDYVAADLVAAIDATYRTRPQRQYRAIGGLSMGGHAALTLALHHTDRFGVVGLHSPSLRTEAEMADIVGRGSDLAAHDPLQLLSRTAADQLPLSLWLDVGDEDRWLEAATALHQRMTELRVAHEFHVFRGIHDSPYWAEHVDDYLTFYGAALYRSVAVSIP